MSVSRTAPAPTRSAGEKVSDAATAAREQTAFLECAEVRDVLAWLRLLVDPHDAAAVVRALARPPIELRQVHVALVIQLARRRKLDLVAGLASATESPQVPPEARERIERFVELHRRAAGGLDALEPEAFLAELIELLQTRARPLLAPRDAAGARASLAQLCALAGELARSAPGCTARELARQLTATLPEAACELPEESALAQAALADARELERTLERMRDELLASVERIGGRLGELRLDTELDISHGVVRYLELLKLTALVQRQPGGDLAEALADINARLLAAASPLQREIFQTSTLDATLLAEGTHGGPVAADADQAAGSRPRPGRARIGHYEEHSFGPFLPRKGSGLALSASDIETYRSCPLRYKFARVLRIPTEQSLHQRFGIAVHQVLERFHSEGGDSLGQMLELLDSSWRRGGFGESPEERALRKKARAALTRYHARLHRQDGEPVWFERSFAFRLGPHHLRGRVDRVDRLAAGSAEAYELIDYKTSRPRTPSQLKGDVQLSLYALAAREAWGLESSRQAYYYVLDDLKVPVPRGMPDEESVTETVLQVGEGILAQEFEPTPSHSACSICDYRIVCPAAES